jgi:hypothetical protein
LNLCGKLLRFFAAKHGYRAWLLHASLHLDVLRRKPLTVLRAD